MYDTNPFRGISRYVIIEANSAEAANDRAIALGIYFYGVDSGEDCECCGDRWFPVEAQEGSDSPMLDGCGVVIKAAAAPDRAYAGYIHYAAGAVKAFGDVIQEPY